MFKNAFLRSNILLYFQVSILYINYISVEDILSMQLLQKSRINKEAQVTAKSGYWIYEFTKWLKDD